MEGTDPGSGNLGARCILRRNASFVPRGRLPDQLHCASRTANALPLLPPRGKRVARRWPCVVSFWPTRVATLLCLRVSVGDQGWCAVLQNGPSRSHQPRWRCLGSHACYVSSMPRRTLNVSLFLALAGLSVVLRSWYSSLTFPMSPAIIHAPPTPDPSPPAPRPLVLTKTPSSTALRSAERPQRVPESAHPNGCWSGNCLCEDMLSHPGDPDRPPALSLAEGRWVAGSARQRYDWQSGWLMKARYNCKGDRRNPPASAWTHRRDFENSWGDLVAAHGGHVRVAQAARRSPQCGQRASKNRDSNGTTNVLLLGNSYALLGRS